MYPLIGAIIRAKRREKDLPQDGLAKRMGLSRATLANMESGRQRILVHQLYLLADVLSCKIEDFLPPLHTDPEQQSRLKFSEPVSNKQRLLLERIIGTVQSPAAQTPVRRRAAKS